MIEELISLIKNLRQGRNTEKNRIEFKRIIQKNIKKICKNLNTRWLISICDTYVDYGNPIEARNALIITVFTNMEKLGQTYFHMFDLKINNEKIKKLRDEPPFELWDGMTSFHLKKGDLTSNMFRRIDWCLKETPELHLIFKTVLTRIKKNDTILGNINKYHRKVFIH